MKREYCQADELGKQRSIGKFRAMAEDGASVQLVLPLAEVMQMVQDGCGQLLREAGLRLMQLVMEEEAERLVGPRHRQDEQRRGLSVGQRSWLLCSRWTEGADRTDPLAQQRRS